MLSDDDGSCRKGAAHQGGFSDADSASIREFRLESSSSDGDMSTDNSSQEHPANSRQAALDEIRAGQNDLMSRIMSVQIYAPLNPRAI